MATKAAPKSRIPQPRVSDVASAVHRIAPPQLAEDWDNVGLQIGDAAALAGPILVALEVTRDVLNEAKALKAGVIVTHHPLLFRGSKKLLETDTTGSLVLQLIRQGHALIAAHTNLDHVAHGTNGELADLLGLQAAGRRFITPLEEKNPNIKYVVFVPTTHVDRVIKAMATVGAGEIGNYTHCTFRSPGTGTYLPTAAANPYAGTAGQLEQAEEVRLECVCPRSKLGVLLNAVRNVHPYEEIAFDVYPLENPTNAKAGLGLIGTLKKPSTVGAIIRHLKKTLGLNSIGLVGDEKKPVETIALCTGSGGDLVRSWRPGTADLYITGEMIHHDCAEAAHKGIATLLIGHWQSEAIVSQRFADMIAQELYERGYTETVIHVSKKEKNPLKRV